MGDRLKLLNRAQLHQEREPAVQGRRSRNENGNGARSGVPASGLGATPLFDTWQKMLPKEHSKMNNEHAVSSMVNKIPTLQQICNNLGLTPATPPNKVLPASPNRSRWSIAGFSRGDASCASHEISDRHSTAMAAAEPRNEKARVSPGDLACETKASWQKNGKRWKEDVQQVNFLFSALCC